MSYENYIPVLFLSGEVYGYKHQGDNDDKRGSDEKFSREFHFYCNALSDEKRHGLEWSPCAGIIQIRLDGRRLRSLPLSPVAPNSRVR